MSDRDKLRKIYDIIYDLRLDEYKILNKKELYGILETIFYIIIERKKKWKVNYIYYFKW